MKVNHSGWREDIGPFEYDVEVDERKSDHVITYQSGRIARQMDKFDYHTYDWNCDGDVYTQFGAFFGIFRADGSSAGRVFLTVEDIVFDLVKGVNGDTFGVDDPCVSVTGIHIEPLNKRVSLDEQIKTTERQQMFRDIEKNKRMASLGIRPNNEPWAK